MKRYAIDIEKLLRSFPSPSNQQVEAARTRVLGRVHAGAALSREGIYREELTASRTANAGLRVNWRLFALPAAALALILAAVAIGMIDSSSAPFAVLEAADSGLYRLSGTQAIRIHPGERIPAKDVVRASGGAAVIRLADESVVEMRSETELSLDRAADGTQIRLEKGDIIVNAAEQDSRRLYVQTRDLTIAVAGTLFLVNAESGGSLVAVIQGEARVQHQGSDQRLRQGEQASTSTAMSPRLVQEEVSWSRNAEAHLALLQQREAAPASMQEGTIGGVVLTSGGVPAAGFRIAALRADTVSTIRAMLSIAETDSTGTYKLQHVPAGRYYIVVGRLDVPTYYPGTDDPDKAVALTISSGTNVSSADFVIQDASAAALPPRRLAVNPAPVRGTPLPAQELKRVQGVVESLMKQRGQGPTQNQSPNQADEPLQRMLQEIQKTYGTPAQGQAPPAAPQDK